MEGLVTQFGVDINKLGINPVGSRDGFVLRPTSLGSVGTRHSGTSLGIRVGGLGKTAGS